MALRAVVWLRHEKNDSNGASIPPSAMGVVRAAISALRRLELDLWDREEGVRVFVDATGNILLRTADGRETVAGQQVAEAVDLRSPFESGGRRGPDLRVPRAHLRILPGKLGGAPHVAHTRSRARRSRR